MLNTDTINKYLEDNTLPPNEGYLLKDIGSGNFIAEWGLEIDEPTTEQLKFLTAAVESDTVMKAWNEEISASDNNYASPKNTARFMEDFYDENPEVLSAKPQEFKEKHTKRKEIRSRRPQE